MRVRIAGRRDHSDGIGLAPPPNLADAADSR